MERSRFDSLAKAFSMGQPRRSVLRGLFGGVAVVAAGSGKIGAAPPQKVAICHGTGNPANPYKLLSLPEPALASHYAHGDFEPFDCDGELSCEQCTPACLPLFCDSADICPTDATEFCPGGPLDPTSSDQAMAACEACFGAGECVHFDEDCSGAGWLQIFDTNDEPPLLSPMFGYEISQCSGSEQPAGRVFAAGNSVPEQDYGYWGTETCPA
jgi:hypothetical protein